MKPQSSSSAETTRRRPVSIIIPCWNAVSFTRRTLISLENNTDHPQWRVIVVDNGSTDGTAEWLAQLDWITVISNPENRGFAKACNQGIEAAGSDDIVLLNNDMILEDPQWLVRMQDIAYLEAATGVVGARLVDGTGQLLHAGSYMPPLKLYGQQIGGGERDIRQLVRDKAVESVVFAQAYIKRDCLEAIGALDETVFAYFEDSEYCLRALKAGRGVVCAGSVESVHVQNTSVRENKVDFWTIYLESRKTFADAWQNWLEHERYDGSVAWHSVVHQPMGYAVQSRKLMEAMHFSGLRISYRNAYGQTDGPTEKVLVDDLIKRPADPDAAQIAFCQADAFPGVNGRKKIGWTMLEVTGLPESWVDGCNSMDEIWVPASFNLESFQQSGVKVPMCLMPLGVDIDYFHPQISAFRPSDRFVFLSVFEWGERKAPEVLLKAFAEEFDKSEDVMLLLSVSNRDPAVDVMGQIEALGLPGDTPLVVMLNSRLPDYQMGSLYRSADCFVLPSRGEGWGMPVLEAMACGVPTIATSWSGPADFLHDGIGFPLQVASLVPAEARCAYYEGFQWAQPDYEHLRFLMREVYERPEMARTKGLAAAKEVAQKYSWEAASARIRTRLRELGELD